jgi:hypothetical protein
VVEPEATVTDGGKVSAEPLAESKTVSPPKGAVWERETVQLPPVLAGSTVGAHAKLLITGGAEPVTFPRLPETAIASPVADEPIVLPAVIVVAPVPEASVAVTTATTPSEIVLTFMPAATHVYKPDPLAHVSVLLACVRAGPAAAVKFAIVPAGYVNVH